MPLEIAFDEIDLSDRDAVGALVSQLGLRQQYPEPKPAERERFPEIGRAWDKRPFWARYLDDRVTTHQWDEDAKVDVGVTADAKAGVIRRVTIKGLRGVEEAKALRGDCWRVRIQTGRTLSADDINCVADELFNPIGYLHQRTFASALRNVRSYFKWENREAVESDGHILPIRELKLPPEDVELLREVFRRLPPVGGAIGVRSGESKASRSVVKDLKTARDKVKQHGGDYADEGFTGWVEQCLQTKTDKWSRARTPLYDHYREWIRKGGHGGNKGEKAEAKATALSEVKWGRLMRRRFPDAMRQDKRSILYRVTLKRGA